MGLSSIVEINLLTIVDGHYKPIDHPLECEFDGLCAIAQAHAA